MPPRRPLIIAHRGLHSVQPENSLEAFQAAWSAGVPWAECDVHESATGPLFVIHDDLLDRTTACTGPVAARLDAELDGCRLRDGHHRLTPCRLPRLADVLRAMPGGCRLMVEVKAVRDYAQLIRDIGRHDVGVQSFDPEDLRLTAELAPEIPLALLVETPAELAAAFELPYRAVHIDHRMLDGDLYRRLSAAGKVIGTWTVNDEAELRRVVGMGVSVVISDEPALAKRVIDAVCGPG